MGGDDGLAGATGGDVPASFAEADAARRVLERLRELVSSLDDVERRVFAALVGPGMARLSRELAVGSGLVQWDPNAVPSVLDAQARERPRSLEVD